MKRLLNIVLLLALGTGCLAAQAACRSERTAGGPGVARADTLQTNPPAGPCRFLLSRRSVRVAMPGRPMSDTEGMATVRPPQPEDRSPEEYRRQVQEEFERRCVEEMPELGAGMPTDLAPSVVVSIGIDAAGRPGAVRVLQTPDRVLGAWGLEAATRCRRWKPAQRLTAEGTWQPMASELWIKLETRDLWSRARERKTKSSCASH